MHRDIRHSCNVKISQRKYKHNDELRALRMNVSERRRSHNRELVGNTTSTAVFHLQLVSHLFHLPFHYLFQTYFTVATLMLHSHMGPPAYTNSFLTHLLPI
jgi:hypothetical protein